jgi:Arm DNA-binding domain/Phage integrase, N-terminal SAM-like domain
MKRGSTWSVVLDVGPDPATGRRRQKWKGGFRTRKAAEAALRELSASVDSGRYVQRSTTSVGDYLDEWLEVVRPRLRPTSWNSYRMPVERMKGRAGAIPLQSLTPLDIESLYKELLLTGRAGNRPLSSKTVRNTHIVLRKALPDAERLGLEAYLRRIQYADDGYPELIHVPAYEDAQVVVDPTRGLRCSGLRARRRACRRRAGAVLGRRVAGRAQRRVWRPAGQLEDRPACRIPTGCLISSSIAAWAASRFLGCSGPRGCDSPLWRRTTASRPTSGSQMTTGSNSPAAEVGSCS